MSDLDLPLDFHLADANVEPVLRLGGARHLTLAIENRSTALFLDPLTDAHHFTLRFRAGVLSEYQKIGVGKANQPDWEVSTQEDQGDILVHLRQKKPDGMEWAAGQTLELTLEGLRGAGVTRRATRVELAYQHIRGGGKEGKALDDKPRHHQLVLITTRSQAHPPLEAHFVGETGDVVLNDGALKNTIVLKLVASKPLTIRSDTSFFLRLGAGKQEDAAGALGTREQLQRIEPKATIGGAQSLTVKPGEDARTVEWEIKTPANTQTDPTVEPPGFLQIELSDIVTKHRNGPSTVRVRWQDLGQPNKDDYPDGEVVATLHKSPLVIVGQAAGIGTTPGHGLELDSETMREVKAEAASAIWAFVGRSVQGNPISLLTKSYPPCENWPCLRLNFQNFPFKWPGLKQGNLGFSSPLAGRVSVMQIDHEGPSSSFFMNSLRDMLKWFKGVNSYMDSVPTQNPTESYGSMYHRLLAVYAIPLKPNSSLYARIDPQDPNWAPGWYVPEQGETANWRRFGLFFDDEHDWFRKDAVAIARWDEAGVRLCDGTIHPCALPGTVHGPLVLSFQNDKVSADWTASPGSPVIISSTYDLKLISPGTEQVYPGLNTTSVNLDVSTLAEGMYAGSVRAVLDGVKSGWCVAEDVVPIFHSAQSMAQGLRKPEKTAQQAALEIWEHFLPVSAIDLRAALGGAGYSEAEVNRAVASTLTYPPYRHVGPVGWTSPDEVSPFDDLAALVPLHEPLSRIEIHLEGEYRDQCIVGIQGFYGSEGKPLPLHGREGYQARTGSKQSVPVTADDPIIKVSESFARVAPGGSYLRVQELTFHYRSGRTVSFGASGGRDGFSPWAFSLPTWRGEVVAGFCGSVFSASQYAGFSSLGILTRSTEPSLNPTTDREPYSRLGPVGLPGWGRTEDQVVKFDDSEAVKALKEPLSKIIVQHTGSGVLGIQAFYGAAGTQQPFHGLKDGESTTVPIAPDDPITEVLGACDRSGTRPVICLLTFHTRSGRAFGPYGKAFRTDLEPFFFATGPGEEVLAFFGSIINYVLDEKGLGHTLPADRRFLSSLGLLTKHTGG